MTEEATEIDAPRWRFAPVPDDQVAPDVTQRDQFNNDSVDLTQATVREATQNSTDQQAGDRPVHLRFAIRTLAPEESRTLQEMMEPLIPHCRQCGLDVDAVFEASARVLVVEDFNTTGLVGAVDRHDSGNFAGFWRRHGGSNKDPLKGGSHGLGKLVFSASSRLGAIFGLTIRDGEDQPYFMGQAILNNHVFEGKRLPAHGFWTASKAGQIQMPDSDRNRIRELSDLLGFARTDEPGLSVAVPYPMDELTEETLSAAVITNYFFPIIAGSLEVTVGADKIDSGNFFELAERHPAIAQEQRQHLEFVKQIASALKEEPGLVLHGFPGDRRLAEEDFDEDQLVKLRDAYAEGELLSVRLPIKVKPKNAPDELSHVDLFLKRKPEGAHPWALFARNSLVLPGEQRDAFREASFGALIARDEGVVRLLRDAENPAHTKWNAREKVRKNWRSGEETVRDIRFSLRDLHRVIAAEARQEHRDLLIDILSIKDPEGKRKKGKRTRTPPIKPPEPSPKVILERRIDGGFRLDPGPGASARQYPLPVRLRIAYDLLSGNPFKLHSPLDFDLTGKGISVDLTNASVRKRIPNVLVLHLENENFRVDVTGFDPRRDLIVDARVI